MVSSPSRRRPPPGSTTALPVPGDDFDPGLPPSRADGCPFCHIAATYPPYDPTSPPLPPPPPPPSTSSFSSSQTTALPTTATKSPLDPEATAPQPNTFIVLSTPTLIGFLDIMPLSRGHLLLCTRSHRSKLTDVSAHEARELGRHLRVLSAAVGRVTGVEDWNVVQNNGAAAAQVVPHMHFHVIPRPELQSKGPERFTSTMFGRGMREDLDEEEAAVLAESVRAAVAGVVREEEEREREGRDARDGRRRREGGKL